MTSIFSSAQRGQIIFFSLFTVGQHSGQFSARLWFPADPAPAGCSGREGPAQPGGGVDNQFVGNACRAGAQVKFKDRHVRQLHGLPPG